ncbi:MAG TPA: hypothetical protein VHZ98_13870 [Galbitalea sp.]|nr:hypothetical protein [Galbitalea sp.]
MWNPRVAHYGSLIVGLAIILVIARDQWFFGDDWAILAPHLDAAVMQPHVGHWNLIPALVFPALRNLIGLGSYLPYLLLALAAHLTVAHLLWRILNRVGVPAWGATIVGFLVVLLGAGAENILWAFQFGFMGAVAIGLAIVLLLDREKLGPVRVVAVIVLAILAPMFSGTFIPLLAAAAIVGLVRRGFLRTVVLFLPAAAIYITWYLTYALHDPNTPQGVHTPAGAAFALVYAGAMLAGGLGRALPWIGLGILPAVAVAVWFVVTVRSGFRGPALVAYALASGAVVFVLLTAYARSGFGLSAAAAQRYAYVTIVLLLPGLSLLVARLVRGRRRWTVLATVLALALVVFNAGTLEVSGEGQAAREQASHRRIDADYRAVTAVHPSTTVLKAPADPKWAPDLLGSDVRQLARWGQLDPN